MNLPLMKSGEGARCLTVFAGFIRKGGLALPPRKQPVRSPSARPDGFAHSVSGIVDSVGKVGLGMLPVFPFDQLLQFAQDRVEGQAGACAFGFSRSRVRKPCATETSVTW